MQTGEQRTLDYAGPLPSPRPRFLTAFLFCVPGLICWCIFIALILSEFLRLNFLPLIAEGMLSLAAISWPVAVITALASIMYFWNKPKPWYVVLCLLINVAGLLFTAWLFVSAL